MSHGHRYTHNLMHLHILVQIKRWSLHTFRHRNGKRSREIPTPLYCSNFVLSFLWLTYIIPSSSVYEIRDVPCPKLSNGYCEKSCLGQAKGVEVMRSGRRAYIEAGIACAPVDHAIGNGRASSN